MNKIICGEFNKELSEKLNLATDLVMVGNRIIRLNEITSISLPIEDQDMSSYNHLGYNIEVTTLIGSEVTQFIETYFRKCTGVTHDNVLTDLLELMNARSLQLINTWSNFKILNTFDKYKSIPITVPMIPPMNPMNPEPPWYPLTPTDPSNPWPNYDPNKVTFYCCVMK